MQKKTEDSSQNAMTTCER